MFIQYRTQGIILKKENRGEADQIFTIYTKDFGKLEILGRAIRKIKSKLRSGMEVFYFSEIEFIQGKTYKTLTDAILIEKFKNLKKDLRKLAIAYKISEVLDRLVRVQESDKKIWQLLMVSLDRLNTLKVENSKLAILFYYFFWNLISLLGYQPELYHCFSCQKKVVLGKLYFSPVNGGIICPYCFAKEAKKRSFLKNDYRPIGADTIKILRMILNRKWDIVKRLKIRTSHQKQLREVSEYFFSIIPTRYI